MNMRQNNNDDQRSTLKSTNMTKRTKYLTWLMAGTLVLAACKKDKDEDPITPTPVNEEEVINKITLHFHSLHDVEHKHFEFYDADGDGGIAPVITADTLSNDSVYNVEIELYNTTVSPEENITEEIEAEHNVHQFFFQPGAVNVSVAYADTDDNGLPVGLQTVWTIGAASSDSITVTLRHEPDKSAPGVSGGDITNAGGETDAEVTFPVVIE